MGRIDMVSGYHFHPTDRDLIDFLKRQIFYLIPVFPLYSCEPWDLPDKSFCPSREDEGAKEGCYLFVPRGQKYTNGPRINRATQFGFWKSTGKDRPIMYCRVIIGVKKTLVYYRGRAPNGMRTDWVMHEYRLPQHEIQVFKKSITTLSLDVLGGADANKAGMLVMPGDTDVGTEGVSSLPGGGDTGMDKGMLSMTGGFDTHEEGMSSMFGGTDTNKEGISFVSGGLNTHKEGIKLMLAGANANTERMSFIAIGANMLEERMEFIHSGGDEENKKGKQLMPSGADESKDDYWTQIFSSNICYSNTDTEKDNSWMQFNYDDTLYPSVGGTSSNNTIV